MSQTASANVTISNKLGLHARPATMFAETAGRFQADITISRADGGDQIDGKSVMQMLMLAATAGTQLCIDAKGPDANDAIEALRQLIESGFDEE